MPEPSESLLTIGEVAARARHLAKDPYVFVDRCRHLAKLGFLKAAEKVGEGPGRHALFPRSESYVAAALCAFAEAGLHPSASRPIADAAQFFVRDGLALWLRKPQPMLLEIKFYPGGRQIIAASWAKKRSAKDIASLKARGIDETAPAMTTITVNLGELFASVDAAKKRE
jgi:hypothetical protein